MTKREGLQLRADARGVRLISRAYDNWAHAGGFAGGWLDRQDPDPLTPERIDHLALAAGCVL